MAAMASVSMTPNETGGDPPVEHLLDTSAAGPAAIRGGALRVGGFFLGLIAGVGSFAVLARHLGVHNTGLYVIAIALVTFVSGLSDLGLTAIGVRELATREGPARDSLARNLLGLRIVLSVVGGVAMVGFAAAVGYEATLVEGVALGAVGLLLQSWQSTLAIGLMSDLRIGWVAAFDLLRTVITGVLIVLLAVAGARLLPFLAVAVPVGIVVLALNALVVRGRIPLMPAFHPAEWRKMLHAVLPYAAAVAAATLYFQLAVIIVSLIASATVVGYFGVSSRTIQVLLVLPGLAVGTAFPIFARAARDDRERLAYALGRVFEVSLLVGVLISICLAIGASIVIAVVGGPKFAPASPVLAIQGVALGASFCGAVWSYGLLSLGRYNAILRINLAALVLGGALVAGLVVVDGAQGAAIGTATGEMLLALLNATALTRVDRRLMPSPRIAPAVIVATGLAVLSTVVELPTIPSVILAATIYCVTVTALGAVPEELRAYVRVRGWSFD
jgi:O-antigen/teichoic acid export membrane protein